jgi:hypothetical protein
MRTKKWFNPQSHSGWSKTQSPMTRRAKLLASTDHRSSMHDRYVEAGRKSMSLSNVTKDKTTSIRARADATYFFRKAKK